ncbi:MAG: hypothetical protein C0403_10370 [Desulfobacterium sp.]|nr:hypothetical protein [Desulfobacterium sp.]
MEYCTMTYPILKTKLAIPPAKSQHVLRQRLNEMLLSYSHYKLTLISAPAGFGKTTALKEWIHSHKIDAAWITLDEGDNTSSRFWTHFIASFQTICSSKGKSASGKINSVSSSFQSVLSELLNEIHETEQDFFLVLEDYHLITNDQIHNDLMFFIDNMPSSIHLFLCTRIDPPIALGRLRVLGELKEIRTVDLRFTSDEARLYLNEVMKLGLDDDDITILEERSEGWIAGLQLAALSIQSQKDKKRFISSFKGSHNFITTYLFEEVFLNQPEHIKSFLLKTTILERMTADLCDAVTEGKDSHMILQKLVSENLFIVQLDNEGKYYRYHQLFSDFLLKHLSNTKPKEVTALHEKACQWFTKNKFEYEAIHHAMAANNLEKAAKLIENYGMTAFYHGEGKAIANWIHQIPRNVIKSSPLLCIIQSMVLFSEKMPGYPEKVERYLDNAEKILSQSEDDGSTGEQIERYNLNYIRATIETLRANLLRENCSQPEMIMEASSKALTLTPDDDYELKCINLVNIVLGHLANENLQTAYQLLDQNEMIAQSCNSHSFFILFRYFKAWIAFSEGRLHKAESICRATIEYIHDRGEISKNQQSVEGIIHLCIGSVMLEWNRVAEARQELAMGIQQIEGNKAFQSILSDGYASLARLAFVEKSEELKFQSIIEKIERLDPFLPGANKYAAALKIRFLLDKNNDHSVYLRSAEELTQKLGIHFDQNKKSGDHRNGLKWNRAAQFSLIRLCIKQNIFFQKVSPIIDFQEAEQFLRCQVQLSEEKGHRSTVVEVRILQALLYSSIGKVDTSIVALEKALTIAEPEGYIRIFLDEGEIMGKLLAEMVKRGRCINYAGKLLRLIDNDRDLQKRPKTLVSSSPSYELIEPLSKREVEVLRLLSTGMSNQETADKLFIARNTIKRHVNNIYGKLAVGNRIQAIHRAKEIEII